jgi:uncharacterized OsmC-like protein
MDLRAAQRPLKEAYRKDPLKSKITLKARAAEDGSPISCSVDIGRAVYEAQAHSGVGGVGTAACSGDLLLGALAACAQITCQMVAAAIGINLTRVDVIVEGDLDLRGTLGVDKEAPVGFQEIRTTFALTSPDATEEEMNRLKVRTEQYCVVYRTLANGTSLKTDWVSA